MAIRYTITNYSCPHCGKVFKTDSWAQLGYLLLIVGTAFLSLSWFLSIAIMRAIFGSSDMPSVGSPFRTCEHCGKKKPIPIFCVIFTAFRSFRVRNRCFRMLLQALFPRSPKLQMVKTVVNHKPPTNHRCGNLCRHFCEIFLLTETLYHKSTEMSRIHIRGFCNAEQLLSTLKICIAIGKENTRRKKLDLFSKKVWTFVSFCGMLCANRRCSL